MSEQRQKLREQYKQLEAEIAKLQSKKAELEREYNVLSDEEQWFEEKMETVTYYENRRKRQKQVLIGRIYWNQGFKDEDTGEVINVTRSRVVRRDGVWD